MLKFMDRKTLVSQWFRFAQDDLDSTTLLYNERPRFSEIICYHCQQSAEKDLKGFLISHGLQSPPKIHDLNELLILCITYNSNFEILSEACLILNPFGVAAKYPLEEYISDTTILKSIKYAEEIKKMVREVVGY